MQHEASGDLSVVLTHLSADELTTYGSQPLFDRIGKTSADPNDFGYSAQFGNVSGTGDNYQFRSSFPGDLWSTAAPLGIADFIPGEGAGFTDGYWTTGLFSPAATNFSFLFGGQPIAGIWRLTITDNAEGPTAGSPGSLLQWELTVDDVSAVPEPNQGVLLGLALLTAAGLQRRAARRRLS